jgi:hypothetical protein
MDFADHAWIKVGDDGVLHVAWSDETSWEERLTRPTVGGNWKLVLEPKINNGEIAVLRGHLVEFFYVKDLIGSDGWVKFFGKDLFSKSEEPLKKLTEDFAFSPKDYKVIKEKTTGSLWWKETSPKCWKVLRQFICKKEQDVIITNLVTADRYVLSKKEIRR